MSYLAKQDRRALIVDAAVELIARDGLQAATVRGVAAHMGASPGQVHHHFKSADALRAEALSAAWMKAMPDCMARIQTGTTRERVAKMRCTDGSDLSRMMDRLWNDALAASRMDPMVRDVVRGAICDMCEMLAGFMYKDIEEGNLPATLDVPLLARRLASMFVGTDVLEDFQVISETEATAMLIALFDDAVARANTDTIADNGTDQATPN